MSKRALSLIIGGYAAAIVIVSFTMSIYASSYAKRAVARQQHCWLTIEEDPQWFGSLEGSKRVRVSRECTL